MRLSLVLPALLFAHSAFADDKKDPSKSNLPIEVKLVLKKTDYKLDADSKQLKTALEAAKKGGKAPPPPAIEGTLEIRNRSDKEVKYWSGGDPVQIQFELKGPAAVTFTPLLAFTSDFRIPVEATLAPGKSASIPLKSLTGGFRNASEYTYWTEQGEYTLTVKFKTGISPAPEGLKPDESGFAQVTIPSDSVKVKVEGK
jgi:hypothetical protein